ncbi:hypothetical protein L3Q82_007500 [Scortum barcoo]|uniref:Uncharacterized protein n=1 Tax=Scortum barcoo TaxID=214431 RepID=A0ACB8WNH5_9TELE|nr:hypothetical protein L3Q82_007500 [Scortum barcoo]
MFRSLSGERHLTGGQSSPPQAGLDVTSPGLLSQESPWIGLLSLVSRPAVALLQQLLPAALRGGPACSAEAESEFFRQLADMKSPPPLTHLSGQQGGGAGLSVDSLRELGLQSSEETDAQLRQQPPGGHLSSARTFLSQAGLSAQEIRPPHGWLRGRPWWGSLWGGEESSGTGLLSDVIWAGEGAGTGRLCPQQAETKAPPAPVFVGGWTLGENTGPTYHKERPANNGGLHTVQNTGGSAPDLRVSTRAVCRGGVALTPDQDNGYSSLEEEHFQMCVVMYMGGAASTKPSAAVRTDMEGGASEEAASSSGHLEEEEEEEQGPSRGCQSGGVEVVSGPQCQNKAIAFIMGCPCSDDDSSQSESSDEEDDDDGKVRQRRFVRAVRLL